jgi:PAS domain S-box-containing protein
VSERQEEQLDLRTVLDALPAMIGYWDSDLRNVVANRAYVDFFGKTPEQMRGSHIRDLLGEDLYEKNLPYLEKALAGEPQQFDRAIPTPSGKVRYTQASYIPDVQGEEVRGIFVLVTDITARRLAELEVERSRQRLAHAERVGRLGSWEWDIPANRIIWSDGLYDIYGINRENFEPEYRAGGSDYVHPEDRDRVEAEVRRALETGAPIDFEYRIIRPDGRVRRLHSRAELTADPEGQPLLMTGSVQDVTEFRAAAEALHQTAAELGRRATALHDLADPAGNEELSHLLTPRQLEILSLVAEGLPNAEIAARLFLSEATVKWHVRKILKGLGVSNRAQAVARYLSAGSATAAVPPSR